MNRRGRHLYGILLAIVYAVLNCSSVQAQETIVTPGNSFALNSAEQCTWYMWKPFQMWGWMNTQIYGDRIFGTAQQQMYADFSELSITLNTTYLPSQTLTCEVTHAGAEMGTMSFPDGTTYTINHSNPSCDGHATLYWGYYPTRSYWISEELYNTSSFLVSTLSSGSSYWGAVGSALGFTELQTPPGGDVGFYPENMGPFVPGRYYEVSGTISLNWTHFSWWNYDKWAFVVAHELGHAVGFGHSSGGQSVTIMGPETLGYEGLLPRTLEKCSAVKVFPVDIKSGN